MMYRKGWIKVDYSTAVDLLSKGYLIMIVEVSANKETNNLSYIELKGDETIGDLKNIDLPLYDILYSNWYFKEKKGE